MGTIVPLLNTSVQMPVYAEDNANGIFSLPLNDDKGLFSVCATTGDITIVYSRGWLDDIINPLDASLTMMLLQLSLILVVFKLLYLLLRPIKQPRVVCDILGGIIFGPMALGGISGLRYYAFPVTSISSTRTFAAFGLMYHLFLMGVKMDPSMVRKSGRKAVWVGVGSVAAPLVATVAACLLLQDYVIASIARSRYLIFLAVFASVTSFPVLGEVLAELNILNTELGRLGMSAAMINGFVGWFFMTFFVVMSQFEEGWKSVFLSMLSLAALMTFILLAVKPCMEAIVRRTPKGTPVSEEYLVAIFGTLMVIGLLSDVIGVSPMNGALIMGLIIPDGPPLGTALIEKAELFANEVMMPLFFFAMGNMVTIPSLAVLEMWLPLGAIIFTGVIAKVVGTTLAAFLCDIPFRNATILGLMMNFRGAVEIIILFHLKFGRLLDDEGFSLLVMLVVLSTAITSPLVSILYDPLNSTLRPTGRRTIQHLKAHSEFCMVACMHDDSPVPDMINIVEASSAPEESAVAIYALHLVDLQGRTDSAVISHKNRRGFVEPDGMDRLLNAFLNYELEKKGSVLVMPYTAVAPLASMHQDICSLAIDKKSLFLLLPYMRKDAAITNADHVMRGIVRDILIMAPCSMGILVRNGLRCSAYLSPHTFQYHVGVIFWGGPDDREALSYASRMARHAGVTLRVTRYVKVASRTPLYNDKEQQLDDLLVKDFMIAQAKNTRVVVTDVYVKDAEDMLSMIRSLEVNYDLLIVGRRLGSDTTLTKELEEWSESPELGIVGDMLATPDFKRSEALLVVQQHV